MSTPAIVVNQPELLLNDRMFFEQEIQKLKIENESLKKKLRDIMFQCQAVLKLGDVDSNSSNNNGDSQIKQTRNPYLELENRPVITRINSQGVEVDKSVPINQNSSEWAWENRPIKSALKKTIQPSTKSNFSRRRSISYCLGEKT